MSVTHPHQSRDVGLTKTANQVESRKLNECLAIKTELAGGGTSKHDRDAYLVSILCASQWRR